MTATLRIGCSGWSYRDWRGTIYPAELPQRRWFEYYTGLFDTVELNSTFYRLPSWPRRPVFVAMSDDSHRDGNRSSLE